MLNFEFVKYRKKQKILFYKAKNLPKTIFWEILHPNSFQSMKGHLQTQTFRPPTQSNLRFILRNSENMPNSFNFFQENIIRVKYAWYKTIFPLYVNLCIQMKILSRCIVTSDNQSTNWFLSGDEQAPYRRKKKRWNIQIEERKYPTHKRN